jgi:3-oxoacyl-[acyl-carrier-protein] synthase II
MANRRVVVTGIGSVSPLGANSFDFWNNLLLSKSGIKKIDTFCTEGIASKVAGYIPIAGPGAFCPDLYMPPSEQRKVDKFIVYAVVAATMAHDDAGFSFLTDEQKENVAVIIGSGIGGVAKLYDTSVVLCTEGGKRVSPFFIPSVLINLASGHVAIKFGFRGPNYGVVSACSSGTQSIGEAFRLVRSGAIDFALAGGAEAAICPLGVAGFSAARAMSTKFNDDPERASRPWDKDRDGFVVGEGSGVLALEALESAKKRAAKIYGEIVGFGVSCDAFHITSPRQDGAGAAEAMARALADAAIPPDCIDYINAHATSTVPGDIAEVISIKKVFRDHAFDVNVSSTKSAIGHLLGAAGSVESIACLLSLRDQVVPPTINLDSPAESCDLNFTPHRPQERKIQYVMNNSFGFGGANATIIFKMV